jgi:outer membrane murein-binding lipoprotein Lpp
MNRNELFDKILNHLIENANIFWVLIPTCQKYFGVSDRRLIESIGDEIIERGWATPKKGDKYSVYIHYDGIEMMKKHKSYSAFEKSINKANNRTKAKKNIKIILSIIGGIGVIYGCVFTYLNYQKDRKIDNQQTEIKKLNEKVDSLKTELKKRTTTPYIKNVLDSVKTEG